MSTAVDWYNQRYEAKGEAAFGRPPVESLDRLRRIKLDNKRGLKVLDVGAGQGYFVAAAQAHHHYAVGVDIASVGLRIAKEIVPEGNFAVADGEHLPFADGSFDVVTFWGTLEHHPDMDTALRECRRVLKPNGTAVIRVPNRDFWVYRAAAWLGAESGTEQQDVIEHLLSYDAWHQLIALHRLQVVAVDADDWFLRQPLRDVSGIAGKVRLFARKLSLAVAPLRQTYVFDFVCKAV